MADPKGKAAATEKKDTPLSLFRAKLNDKAALAATLQEGLKSTNGKVRAFAAKVAIKTQDSKFVKSNVMPLVKSDKAQRVLKRISKSIKRSEIAKRIEDLAKAAPKKKEAAPAEGEAK